MKDEELLHCLRTGKNTRALRHLYKYLPVVKKRVMHSGGSREDALDVYQEALVVFCTKAADPEFQLTASVSTYLYSIARFKWMEECRRRNRADAVQWPAENPEETDTWLQHETRLHQLTEILQETGNKCQRIFHMFYFEKLDMKVIAARLGYTSELNAATQKYKCMERARKLAREKNLLNK